MEDTQIDSEIVVEGEQPETEVKEDVVEQKPEQPKETPEAKKARLERQLKRLNKELGIEDTVEKVEAPKAKTDTLDEVQLEILELKGYSHEDDVAFIQKMMVKTNQTLRETLKDDYVISKLKDFKAERDVKAATPSSNKRGASNPTDNEDYYWNKYEQTGKLPDNISFEMKARLVNRKAAQSDSRKNPFE